MSEIKSKKTTIGLFAVNAAHEGEPEDRRDQPGFYGCLTSAWLVSYDCLVLEDIFNVQQLKNVPKSVLPL